jgi:uncharacterized membrane protein YphA (DoxX/SURF4 family)
MTLLRAAYRTMLASYFVANGVKALRDPESLVPVAEPLTDKVVPLLKEYAPQQVAGYIPQDARTLVRVNGATQLVGGLALASGKGRRLGALLLAGSLVPSTIAKHPFWSRSDDDQRIEDQHQFLKNVSLLGGVLLASVDTEGKPSLAWRAQAGGKAIAKTTSKASDKIAKNFGELTDSGSDFADTALAAGAALAGTVVATSRRARKQATKQFAKAQKVAAEQAEQTRKAAIQAARQARREAPKQFKAAKKAAAERAQQAREQQAIRAREQQKEAALRAKQEKKVAAVRSREQQKEAAALAKEEQKLSAIRAREEQKAAAALAKEARRADKRAKNIKRGEN